MILSAACAAQEVFIEAGMFVEDTCCCRDRLNCYWRVSRRKSCCGNAVSNHRQFPGAGYGPIDWRGYESFREMASGLAREKEGRPGNAEHSTERLETDWDVCRRGPFGTAERQPASGPGLHQCPWKEEINDLLGHGRRRADERDGERWFFVDGHAPIAPCQLRRLRGNGLLKNDRI